MANPTTNFGWVMPTSTSLVTNLPADFNTFGQAVDTSMSELLGGTTGQVLSKTSNTNMDFTWVTPTDQTPLTTKGDLFTFSTVDARLAVGTNGQTLVADSTAATGLKWATASSGSMTQLATGSLSGSSVSITSISGSYKHLMLQVYNFAFSATGEFRFTFNSGTANYGYTTLCNGTATGSGVAGVAYGSFGGTVQTYNDNPSVWLQIPFYSQSGTNMQWIGAIEGVNGVNGGSRHSMTFGGVNNNGALTSIQLFPQSGTFSAGTYYLYGVN